MSSSYKKGLEVNLSERAHIAVWGKTGSKKTTVLFGIILQLFSMGADVRFIDGKDEFGSFKGFYPADKIVSDIEPVFRQLDDILAIIKKRQKIMADEVQKRQKIGLKSFRSRSPSRCCWLLMKSALLSLSWTLNSLKSLWQI